MPIRFKLVHLKNIMDSFISDLNLLSSDEFSFQMVTPLPDQISIKMSRQAVPNNILDHEFQFPNDSYS